MHRARAELGRAGGCRAAGVGRSGSRDPAVAGAAAVRAALDRCDDPRVVLLFASGALGLEAVAASAASVAGPVPLAGCSTAATLGAADDGGDDGVVALALGGDGLSVSTLAAPLADARDAGMRAAACVGDVADRPHRLLLLLAGGRASEHAELVRGAYSVTGAGVPLAGGIAAARQLGREHGALIQQHAVLREAAIGVALGSDAPLGVGVAHGWTPIGDPLLVTGAAPGRVLELDDRPALDVYLERTGLPRDLTPEQALAHPLARHGCDGPTHVRAVELHGCGDAGLPCALEAGSLVSVMRASDRPAVEIVDDAVGAALAPLDGAAPRALLAFDCAGRAAVRRLAGHGPGPELARLRERARGGAVAAVSTHGELARTRGIAALRHQSIVVVAVG